MITDERLVSEQSTAQQFQHRVTLPPGTEQAVDVIEDTQLARVFATILDTLQQARPPFLIWVHAQAMQAPWDAPYFLRAQFAEEGDPDPPVLTTPEDLQLDDDYDPDLLLGLQHAYGGQVMALDTCLGVFLETLWSSEVGSATALLATASRGYPLGEHLYVGRHQFPLFGELVQVPYLNCWPDGAGAMWRVHRMVQPPDLYPTILDWFGVPPASDPLWGLSLRPSVLDQAGPAASQLACSEHDRQRAIRVPAWFLRQAGDGPPQLYAKPDDRWEFNEISNRCGAIVDDIADVITQFEAAARADDRHQLPTLSELLMHGLD